MIPIKLICCYWSVFDCRTIIILSVDEAFISGLLEGVEYLILLRAVHTAGPSQYKHVGCTGWFKFGYFISLSKSSCMMIAWHVS